MVPTKKSKLIYTKEKKIIKIDSSRSRNHESRLFFLNSWEGI